MFGSHPYRCSLLVFQASVYQPDGQTRRGIKVRPIFSMEEDSRFNYCFARARAELMTASSDLLTDVRAYDECVGLRAAGKSQGAVKMFCDDVRFFPVIVPANAQQRSQNFISPSTIRDVTSLRADLLSALSGIGFVPFGAKASDPALNAHSTNENLVKAVILGGLWPRVARVNLPQSAIKFDKVSAGSEILLRPSM